MASEVISLADAIVEAINEGDLGVKSVRTVLPKLLLKNVSKDVFTVLVSPRVATDDRNNRCAWTDEYVIQILVARRTTEGNRDADADESLGKAEDIRRFLRKPEQDTIGEDFRFQSSEFQPLYGDDHLEDYNQYTSILLATYQKTTAA